MYDKKIQARNKFVGKISGKIEKLNKDIELLIQVDNALNEQAGGSLLGDVAFAMTSIKTPTTIGTPTIKNDALTAAAQQLSAELSEKIDILERTLRTLLEHIGRHNPTIDLSARTIDINDASSIAPLAGINTLLQTKFEPDKLKKFNELYAKYSTGTLQSTQQAAYKKAISDANLGSNEINKLLHDAIMSTRKNAGLSELVVSFP